MRERASAGLTHRNFIGFTNLEANPWLTPTTLMSPRFMRVTVQFDF